MSAIAPIGSTADYSAIASLLNSGFSSQATDTPQAGQGSDPASSPSPTDSVDLSDHAKAVLAQAQQDQVLASKLQALVQSNKNPVGSGTDSVSDQSTQSQSGSTWNPSSYIDNSGNYLQAQQSAHTQADGSIESWSTSASNVFNVPSTPEDVDQWYQTQGQQMLQIAQAFPSSFPGMAEAIQNHTLTFTDARSIPGLNFQNSYTAEGGESGAGGSAGASFNSSLPMFQDPSTHYQVMNDGTVLSWPASSQ